MFGLGLKGFSRSFPSSSKSYLGITSVFPLYEGEKIRLEPWHCEPVHSLWSCFSPPTTHQHEFKVCFFLMDFMVPVPPLSLPLGCCGIKTDPFLLSLFSDLICICVNFQCLSNSWQWVPPLIKGLGKEMLLWAWCLLPPSECGLGRLLFSLFWWRMRLFGPFLSWERLVLMAAPAGFLKSIQERCRAL